MSLGSINTSTNALFLINNLFKITLLTFLSSTTKNLLPNKLTLLSEDNLLLMFPTLFWENNFWFNLIDKVDLLFSQVTSILPPIIWSNEFAIIIFKELKII